MKLARIRSAFNRIGEERARAERRADALGFNRLDLVFGLAGADEDAERRP